MLSAGDLSGDIHAARLVTEISKRHPEWKIHALGGRNLKQAGAELLHDTSGYGVIGFATALKLLPGIPRLKNQILRFVRDNKIDAIVMVDWGAFNVRLAKLLQPHGIPILYYFPPRSWQKTGDGGLGIVPYVQRVATPFEWSAQRLKEAGCQAEWVGHPLLEIVDEARRQQSREVTRAQLRVPPGDQLIAILPGSRDMELKTLSPRLAQAARRLKSSQGKCHFVVAVPKGVAARVRRYFVDDVRIVENRSTQVLLACDAAWVKSGTATLEAALCGAPQLVVYDLPPLLRLQWHLTGLGKKIPLVAMPNIILGEHRIPEILGNECTAANLIIEMEHLLETPSAREAQQVAYGEVRRALGEGLPYTASQRTAAILDEMMAGK